eukprot:4142759-Prorocentrum_lima.AAC.1
MQRQWRCGSWTPGHGTCRARRPRHCRQAKAEQRSGTSSPTKGASRSEASRARSQLRRADVNF